MKNNEEKNTQRSDVVAHTCQLCIWKAEPGEWKFKASFSYTASSKAAWLHKNPAQKQKQKKMFKYFSNLVKNIHLHVEEAEKTT